MTLNPARLAYFTDWAKTLPPRPLPRTVTPAPGEYFLDYIARLAEANHLEFAELTGTLNDPASILYHPDRSRQHEQERLACHRCTARRGITGPVACFLPPHQTVCRRHRRWTGPAARTCAGQLDISPFPEVLRAQRRHYNLAQLHHSWRLGDAVRDATGAIYQAMRAGTWIPGQQQRMHQLAPGTWQQALTSVLTARPGWQDDHHGHPAVEIAIYPDVVWLAARSLRGRGASYRTAV